MTFDIKLISDKEWSSHCKSVGVSPINAGYAVDSTLVIKQSVMSAALNGGGWERTLVVHEVSHFMGTPSHPHNAGGYAWNIKQPVKLIKFLALDIIEAVKYGFDERAFTRFLRWRKSGKYASYWKLAKRVHELS